MPPLPPPYNLLDYVLKRVAEEDVKPLVALIQAEYAAHVAHIEDEDNQGKRADTQRFSIIRGSSSLVDWLEPPSSLCIALLRPLMTTFSLLATCLLSQVLT